MSKQGATITGIKGLGFQLKETFSDTDALRELVKVMDELIEHCRHHLRRFYW